MEHFKQLEKVLKLPFRRFLLLTILSISSMFIGVQEASAHATQVGYCVLNNGLVRVYIEHWHGDLSQNNLNNNGIALSITSSGGTTTIPNLDPDGFYNNTTVNNLPGCGPNLNIVSACPGTGFGSANFHNDWVYYDFPPLACGEQISITINAGNTVLLTEACGSLYPATINATFFDSGGPVISCPPDVNVTNCGPTVVNYPPATVVDDCDPNPTITGYSHPSGSTFPQGSTQVTVSAEDNLNQVGTCSFNVNINEPPGGCCPASLQLSGATTLPTCPGDSDGAIALSVGAGTAPHSFSWSNGATSQNISGLAAGSYTVDVTDANGCTDMLTVNLPDGVDNTDPNVACQNVTVYLNDQGEASVGASEVDGGTSDNCVDFTLDLSGQTSFDCSDLDNTYTVTLTAEDGSGNTSSCTAQVTVSDDTLPDDDCDGFSNICDVCDGGDDNGPCNASSFPGVANIPGYWLCHPNGHKVSICHNGNTICVSFNAVQAHLNHGDFLGPCSSCDSEGFAASVNSGNTIESIGSSAPLKVFPNPANGEVNIHIEDVEFKTTLTIFDIHGRIVWQFETEPGQVRSIVDISGQQFESGIYTVLASNENGSQSQRLVVIK